MPASSARPQGSASRRNETLDSLKLVAVFFVIGIHSFPLYFLGDPQLATIGLVFNQLCRFAVPSFFVVSGYLFATTFDFDRPGQKLLKTTRRLLGLYAFWCVFYLIPYDIALIPQGGIKAPWDFAAWHFYMWTLSWKDFLFGGAKAQLWFLPALWCATVISAPFVFLRQPRRLLAVGLVLFVIALLAGPYKTTPVGFDLAFLTRNGPFFSTLFFASGVFLALHKGNAQRRLRWAYGLTLAGLAWHLAELFWLKLHYDSLYIYDFNSGTFAFGVGAAMLGIYGARPLQNRWLVRNGQYSLGIFLLHMFVMDFLFPLNKLWAASALWSIALPFLTFGISLYLVRFLMRYPIGRRLLA